MSAAKKAARVLRRRIVTESVEVPDGHEVCPECGGRGMLSKYDEGMRSFAHDPGLSALRNCVTCAGVGYVRARRALLETDGC